IPKDFESLSDSKLDVKLLNRLTALALEEFEELEVSDDSEVEEDHEEMFNDSENDDPSEVESDLNEDLDMVKDIQSRIDIMKKAKDYMEKKVRFDVPENHIKEIESLPKINSPDDIYKQMQNVIAKGAKLKKNELKLSEVIKNKVTEKPIINEEIDNESDVEDYIIAQNVADEYIKMKGNLKIKTNSYHQALDDSDEFESEGEETTQSRFRSTITEHKPNKLGEFEDVGVYVPELLSKKKQKELVKGRDFVDEEIEFLSESKTNELMKSKISYNSNVNAESVENIIGDNNTYQIKISKFKNDMQFIKSKEKKIVK
ncbi:hypothetical protein HK096_001274, partial [Nowakowskiella sp. JEL0078]